MHHFFVYMFSSCLFIVRIMFVSSSSVISPVSSRPKFRSHPSLASLPANLVKKPFKHTPFLIPTNAIPSLHSNTRHSFNSPFHTRTPNLLINPQARNLAAHRPSHVPLREAGSLADLNQPILICDIAPQLKVAAEEILQDGGLREWTSLLQG